jgi:hypothetical protein
VWEKRGRTAAASKNPRSGMERLNTSPMTIAYKTLFCENRGGAGIPKFKNLKEFKLKLKHQKKQVIF